MLVNLEDEELRIIVETLGNIIEHCFRTHDHETDFDRLFFKRRRWEYDDLRDRLQRLMAAHKIDTFIKEHKEND